VAVPSKGGGGGAELRAAKENRVPSFLCLVVDVSSSMGFNDRLPAVASALEESLALLPPTISMSIVLFGSAVEVQTPGPEERLAAFSAIGSIEPSGHSAMWDAVVKALEMAAPFKEGSVVILVADGEDNASIYSEQEVMELAAAAGSPVYTIGLDVSTRAAEQLRRLASVSGAGRDGEGYFDVSTRSEIADACRAILLASELNSDLD